MDPKRTTRSHLRIAGLLVAALLAISTTAHAGGDAVATRLQRRKTSLQRELTKLASGLEAALVRRDLLLAESLYRLESATIRWTLDASEQVRSAEGQALTAEGRALLRQVVMLQNRLGEHALGEIRRAIPGEPLTRKARRYGRDAYRPLARVDSFESHGAQGATPAEMPQLDGRTLYRRAFKKFRDKGGSAELLKRLEQAHSVDVPAGKVFSWVQLLPRSRSAKDGQVLVGPAKHIVLSGGRWVAGAGSIKPFVNRFGEDVILMLSADSGTYKPGVGALPQAAQAFGKAWKIPQSHIVLGTEFKPNDPQILKILMMSKRQFSAEQITARAQKLVARYGVYGTTRGPRGAK